MRATWRRNTVDNTENTGLHTFTHQEQTVPNIYLGKAEHAIALIIEKSTPGMLLNVKTRMFLRDVETSHPLIRPHGNCDACRKIARKKWKTVPTSTGKRITARMAGKYSNNDDCHESVQQNSDPYKAKTKVQVWRNSWCCRIVSSSTKTWIRTKGETAEVVQRLHALNRTVQAWHNSAVVWYRNGAVIWYHNSAVVWYHNGAFECYHNNAVVC